MARDLTPEENPYMREFERIHKVDPSKALLDYIMDSFFSAPFSEREKLVSKYSWAVPSNEAIKKIAEYGPICEWGAGSGYWAHLLQKVGVDVIAYDAAPWDTLHFPVKREADTSVIPGDRALLLVWPPYENAMAYNALQAYAEKGGKTLIYVGEDYGGCCASDEFFQALPRLGFTEDADMAIPTYSGVNDGMVIYTR